MVRYYKLTPPGGEQEPFRAKFETDPQIVVYSTRRTGKWEVDPKIKFEDLMMPEQGPLYDWDVERIEQEEDV